MRLPKNRRPTVPGDILLRDYLEPRGLTQLEASRLLRMTYARLSEIIHGKRGITADTALRLAKLLGTTPDLWLNLQSAVDLWDAQHSEKTAAALKEIRPFKRSA